MKTLRTLNGIAVVLFLLAVVPANADVIAVIDAGGLPDGTDQSFEDLSTGGDTVGDMTGIFEASDVADWTSNDGGIGHWNADEFDFGPGSGKDASWIFGGLTPDEEWDVYVAWNNVPQANLTTAAAYTIQDEEDILVDQNAGTAPDLVLTDASAGEVYFQKLGTATVDGEGEIIVTLRSADDNWVICDAVAIRPFGLSCAPVTNLQCMVDSETCQVDLSWELGDDPYESIEVRRNGAVIATLGGGEIVYADEDEALGDASHTYEVEGICAAGTATFSPSCTVLMPSCEPAVIAVLDAGGINDGSGQSFEDLSTGGETVGDVTGFFTFSAVADWVGLQSQDTRWNNNEFDYGPGSTETGTWIFSGLTPDEEWDVYASWGNIGQANLSQAAPYTIQGEEVLVNQEIGASPDLVLLDARPAAVNFQKLGTAVVDGVGEIVVTLSGAVDDWVICDAIAIRPAGLACDAIKNLACTPDSETCEMALSWELSDTPYESIEVSRDGAAIATLPGDDTAYVDDDVAGGTSYTYEVKGTCATGRTSSPTACTTLMPSCESAIIAVLDAGGLPDGTGQSFEDLSTGGEAVGDITGFFTFSFDPDYVSETAADLRWNGNEFDYGPGSGETATWIFSGLNIGETWDVYASWGNVGQVNLSQAAPYTLQDGEEILVNQEAGAAPDLVLMDASQALINFQKLGTVEVDDTEEIVVALSGAADDWVIADAIAITPSAGVACPSLRNLQCTPNAAAGEAALSWALGDGTYTSIEVRRDDNLIATLAGTDTSYLDGQVIAGGTYTYKVEGICAEGSAVSVPSCDVTLSGGGDTIGVFIGDVNGDDTVNLADAISLLTHLFVTKGLPCLKSADANDDDKLDLADAISILTYQFQNGSLIGPDGGVITSDTVGCHAYPAEEVEAMTCDNPCE